MRKHTRENTVLDARERCFLIWVVSENHSPLCACQLRGVCFPVIMLSDFVLGYCTEDTPKAYRLCERAMPSVFYVLLSAPLQTSIPASTSGHIVFSSNPARPTPAEPRTMPSPIVIAPRGP